MTSMVAEGQREAESFLRGAFCALVFLDAKGGGSKRVGPVADARWRAFAGANPTLTEPDRLALLLRDASALHPAVFSARAVFALRGVSEDEPFGPWSRELSPGETAPLFRAPPEVTSDALALFDAIAERWGLSIEREERDESLGPTSRVVLAGAAALRAACVRFAQDGSLDASAQWIVVADAPAARQLAGAAAMALGSKRALKAVTVLSSREAERSRDELVARGIDRADRLWVSDDADARERDSAVKLATTLGWTSAR